MEALCAEAIAKHERREALTELEKLAIFRALGLEEFRECERWAQAFKEFNDLQKKDEQRPVPEFPIGDGIHCWSLDSSEEYHVVSFDSYSDDVTLKHAFDHSKVRTLKKSEITTLSPFGRYDLLRNIGTGSRFYYYDNGCWKSAIMSSKEGGHFVCKNPGTLMLENGSMVVSYFPPEWSGPTWSIHPFTHELRFVNHDRAPDCRTKNTREISAYVRANKTGLKPLWDFITSMGDYVHKVPGVDYVRWNPNPNPMERVWQTVEGPIPDDAIPDCWQHGTCRLTNTMGVPDTACGWYMNYNGLRFTGTNLTIPYGVRFVYLMARKMVNFESCSLGCNCGIVFDSIEDIDRFGNIYITNTSEYHGSRAC